LRARICRVEFAAGFGAADFSGKCQANAARAERFGSARRLQKEGVIVEPGIRVQIVDGSCIDTHGGKKPRVFVCKRKIAGDTTSSKEE